MLLVLFAFSLYNEGIMSPQEEIPKDESPRGVLTPPENLPVASDDLPEDFFVMQEKPLVEIQNQKVHPVTELLRRGEGKKALEYMEASWRSHFSSIEEIIEVFTENGYLYEFAEWAFSQDTAAEFRPNQEEDILEAVILQNHPDKQRVLEKLLPEGRDLSGKIIGMLLAEGLPMSLVENNIASFQKGALKDIRIEPRLQNALFLAEHLSSFDEATQENITKFVFQHASELLVTNKKDIKFSVKNVEVFFDEVSITGQQVIEHIDFVVPDDREVIMLKAIQKDELRFFVAEQLGQLENGAQTRVFQELLTYVSELERYFKTIPHFMDVTVKQLPNLDGAPKELAYELIAVHDGYASVIAQHVTVFAATDHPLILRRIWNTSAKDVALQNLGNFKNVDGQKVIETLVREGHFALLTQESESLAPSLQQDLVRALAVAKQEAYLSLVLARIENIPKSVGEMLIAAGYAHLVAERAVAFVELPDEIRSIIFDQPLSVDLVNDILSKTWNLRREDAAKLVREGCAEAVLGNLKSFRDVEREAIIRDCAEYFGVQKMIDQFALWAEESPNTTFEILARYKQEQSSPVARMKSFVKMERHAPLEALAKQYPHIFAKLRQSVSKTAWTETLGFGPGFEAQLIKDAQEEQRLQGSLRVAEEEKQKQRERAEYESRPDIAMAREVLGDDMYGALEAMESFKIDIDLREVPRVPFSPELLERVRGEMCLRLQIAELEPGIPANVQNIADRLKNRTSNGDSIVGSITTKDAFFEKEVPERMEWVLEDKVIGAKNENYFQQTAYLVDRLRQVYGSKIPQHIQERIDEYEKEKQERQNDTRLFKPMANSLAINQVHRNSAIEVVQGMILNPRDNEIQKSYVTTKTSTVNFSRVSIGRPHPFLGVSVDYRQEEYTKERSGVRLVLRG